jgi:hypothetical protein
MHDQFDQEAGPVAAMIYVGRVPGRNTYCLATRILRFGASFDDSLHHTGAE